MKIGCMKNPVNLSNPSFDSILEINSKLNISNAIHLCLIQLFLPPNYPVKVVVEVVIRHGLQEAMCNFSHFWTINLIHTIAIDGTVRKKI